MCRPPRWACPSETQDWPLRRGWGPDRSVFFFSPSPSSAVTFSSRTQTLKLAQEQTLTQSQYMCIHVDACIVFAYIKGIARNRQTLLPAVEPR